MRANEALPLAVLNALPLQIAVLDQTGVIVAVNDAWTRFAQENGDLGANHTGVGVNYLAVCRRAHGKDAAFAQAALTGVQAVLGGEQSTFTLEYPCHSPTTKRWFLMQVAPFASVGDGVVITHLAITQRKETEEALCHSEAHNRALLEAIPDVIARVRRDGLYLEIIAPKNFTPVRPVAEMIGQKQADVLPAAMARQFRHHQKLALQTGKLQTFEYTVQSDDEVRAREARIVPVGPDEVIAILRDITEVVQQRAQLRALTRRLAELQEAERKELARELHDQVGQNLVALGLNLKIIQEQLPLNFPTDAAVQSRLEDSLALVEQITGVTRDIMTALRPRVLDDYGLLATLHWYGAHISTRSTLQVTVQGEEPRPRLAENVENALFRIAQEALTNMTKHAQATQATITLSSTPQQVVLLITDNGRGFRLATAATAAAPPRWGLLNMQERAAVVGGQCSISSQPGAGTSIRVEVPR